MKNLWIGILLSLLWPIIFLSKLNTTKDSIIESRKAFKIGNKTYSCQVIDINGR